MAGQTKLALSDYELQLVQNSEWILTKQEILSKATALLALAAEKMEAVWNQQAQEAALRLTPANPKISKGENYKGLPYVMLDYPRYFGKEDVLAIRSFFWWGNFFSSSLLLSGSYKNIFQETVLQNLQRYPGQDLYICIHEDPWQHHFDKSNYRLLHEIPAEELNRFIRNKSFIKLAQKFPLEAWEGMPGLLGNAFEAMLQMVKA